LAQTIRDDFAFRIAMQSNDDGVSTEISKFQAQIESLTPSQKIALRTVFPAMMETVQGKADGLQGKLRTAGIELQNAKTEDEQVAEKMEEATPTGTTLEYRI